MFQILVKFQLKPSLCLNVNNNKMGYRISLYCVPKTVVNKYREYKEEDYEKDDDFLDNLEKDTVKYDTLTDVISLDNDGRFSTRLFKNRLSVEDDMYFGSISKEQLLNIIEEVRNNYVSKWFNDRVVTDKEIGETFKNPTALYLMKDEPWTSEDARKANQMEWNHKALLWKSHFTNKNGEEHYPNINVDIKNKWIVSGSGLYEYTIFDLIHILKIFDWENDELICIGG